MKFIDGRHTITRIKVPFTALKGWIYTIFARRPWCAMRRRILIVIVTYALKCKRTLVGSCAVNRTIFSGTCGANSERSSSCAVESWWRLKFWNFVCWLIDPLYFGCDKYKDNNKHRRDKDSSKYRKDLIFHFGAWHQGVCTQAGYKDLQKVGCLEFGSRHVQILHCTRSFEYDLNELAYFLEPSNQ